MYATSCLVISLPAPSNKPLSHLVVVRHTRARHASGQRWRRTTGKGLGPRMPVIPSVETSATQDQGASHRRDARAALEAQTGIVIARIPKDNSLARLADYLRKNQPFPLQVTSLRQRET